MSIFFKITNIIFKLSPRYSPVCGLFSFNRFSHGHVATNSPSSPSAGENDPIRILGQQYQILDPSVWPALLSLSLLALLSMAVAWMFYLVSFFFVVAALVVVIFTMGCWFYDLHYESIYEGQQTAAVERNIRLGMVLFIVSEIFFFLAFFWAYLHNALNPSIFIGGVWPPYGLIPYSFDPTQVVHYSAIMFIYRVMADYAGWQIEPGPVLERISAEMPNIVLAAENTKTVFSVPEMFALVGTSTWKPYGMPLAMTFILITSGLTLTASHIAICVEHGSLMAAIRPLVVTLILAFSFLLLQFFEYVNLPISINDGIFGSTFFMATGFHGFHVLVGSIILAVCLLRMYQRFFASDGHVSFECGIWYWHFVDVVWIFLFAIMYWWAKPDDYVLFYFAAPSHWA
jgi:cytochrome c oxidase subunit 3